MMFGEMQGKDELKKHPEDKYQNLGQKPSFDF
jgi:hypothetical protein